MKILIKNGHIIDPSNSINEVLDVLIVGGFINKIEKEINILGNDVKVIDAGGKFVVPGLFDMHCHLREPGFEYKEDIKSGSMSAAKGGFTTIACMPNTNPVIDNKVVADYVVNKAKEADLINVLPIGAISKGLMGEQLSEIGELKKAGVVAISDDGKPVMNANFMRRAMQYAKTFEMPVISHCEDLNLADDGAMNEGYVSTTLGLRGITPCAEEVMVARDVNLAENLNTTIHIAHISTKGSVEIIRQAKKRGVKVTCETCPHYFSLTEEAVIGFDTNAKMNPPLRTSEDINAIIEGLKDNTIDVIATDHAPHHIDEKNVEFDKALNGIVGFETALPISITYLVKNGHLTLSQIVEKMSINPSKILNIGVNEIALNSKANITIIDINEKYEIDVNSFLSKSKNSPYNNFEVFGKALYTIVNGKIVYSSKA